MPAWVNAAYQEYAKRISNYCKLELIEIATKPYKDNNINNNKLEEAKLILNKINKIASKDYIIALDLSGRSFTTEELAEYFSNLSSKQSVFNITMLIGGPDGLDSSCLNKADVKISLSKLTFPHPLVRVILAEQLYRVFAFLNNHPYHK